MTTVYFIRHAESDRTVYETQARPLTGKGLVDAERLVALFADIPLHRIYASTYKRAVDTVMPLAKDRGLDIVRMEALRERERDSIETMSMEEKVLRQWTDFDYVPLDGESYREVQRRNIDALRGIIAENEEQSIAVGTHGIAMCTMIHFYSPLGLKELEGIMLSMPYVTRLRFDQSRFVDIAELPLA